MRLSDGCAITTKTARAARTNTTAVSERMSKYSGYRICDCRIRSLIAFCDSFPDSTMTVTVLIGVCDLLDRVTIWPLSHGIHKIR